MNVLSYLLQICPWRENSINFDSATVEVLRAIYKQTDPDNESSDENSEESDSQDSDYEPDENINDESSSEEESSDEDEDLSEDVSEQIIIRKDKEGNYYIY
jgi:Ran GTPase-activating protein (RanGAP) involved in mRNA processing and transport